MHGVDNGSGRVPLPWRRCCPCRTSTIQATSVSWAWGCQSQSQTELLSISMFWEEVACRLAPEGWAWCGRSGWREGQSPRQGWLVLASWTWEGFHDSSGHSPEPSPCCPTEKWVHTSPRSCLALSPLATPVQELQLLAYVLISPLFCVVCSCNQSFSCRMLPGPSVSWETLF